MPVPSFTSQEDLERRFGAARVRQYLDDNGDGIVDQEVLAEVTDDANGEVVSLCMRKGYTAEQLELLADDPVLRRRATEIAMAYASERKPEWLNSVGEGPFESLRKRAKEFLKQMQLGEVRPPTEPEAGVTRQHVEGNVGQSSGFVFAESDDDPLGPGGF